ncbi:DUF1822 family protein [Brasilonema sp. UFV-L1]|uniref:DUF1822 family protein n=1 Tax=Brasilonema sp. UFV-L1 TaxID=2234130 RepID=UPI00145C6E63|nr:DUF1822 family protein [Brasilonema sp. UFV-L1]NMG05603.1 hypothetical protein [Brasilonema sp. UFV-L1]
MSSLIKNVTFTAPITMEAYRLAEQFSRGQKDSEKAQQIRLNTLAVYAVNFYCQCMEIETELDKSYSWNSASRLLMNVADLQIKNVGKLECLPVLPNTRTCHISSEAWNNRIGYVVVQIDEEAWEATLLGFVEKVTKEELSLNQLNSLEDLLDTLEPVPVVSSFKNIISELEQGLVRLNQWFDGLFDGGWQPEKLVFASAFRSVRSADELEVNAAKVIRLGMQMPEHHVTLIVRQRKLSEEEIDIRLRLYPGNDSLYLADGVKLTVLDEFGEPIPTLEAEAKKVDNWLQLQFTASPGDQFCVKVTLEKNSITEKFVI